MLQIIVKVPYFPEPNLKSSSSSSSFFTCSIAFTHYLLAVRPVPVVTSENTKTTILPSLTSSTAAAAAQFFRSKARKLSIFSRICRIGHSAKVKSQESEISLATEAFTNFKHLLLPITDQNPYLLEGTRQAAAITAALAKKYGADITVVVINEKQKESLPEHETQLSSIQWHLSEGGFGLLEKLGHGSKQTAIIGEVADDLNLDLVVMSMEAIPSKHVDANLLAEFIPCPILPLPL